VDQRYPLGFYYRRWNNDYEGTPPSEPEDIAAAQYLFVDINQLDERLTGLVAGTRRVFWVQWFKTDTDPRGAVDFLFRKYGSLLGEQWFRGYIVRTYGLPADTTFELEAQLSPVGLVFGDQVELVSWSQGGRESPASTGGVVEQDPSVHAGEPAWVVARWRSVGAASGQIKASLRLVGPEGELVGQDDRPLLNDRHLALPYWESEDTPLNVYLIDLGADTPPGTYSWQIVVYDGATLAALPWRDSSGRIHGEPAVMGELHLVASGSSAQ
jgi:hypothetical protein